MLFIKLNVCINPNGRGPVARICRLLKAWFSFFGKITDSPSGCHVPEFVCFSVSDIPLEFWAILVVKLSGKVENRHFAKDFCKGGKHFQLLPWQSLW